jgi:hypothetical protein
MYFLPDRIDGTASIHGFSIYLPNEQDEAASVAAQEWMPGEPEDIYFGSMHYIWSPGAHSDVTSLSEFRLATPEDFKQLINQILPQTLHLHFDKSYKGDRNLYMWFAYSGRMVLTGVFRLPGCSVLVKTIINEIEIRHSESNADLTNGLIREANQEEIDMFSEILLADKAAIDVMSDQMFRLSREAVIGKDILYKSGS